MAELRGDGPSRRRFLGHRDVAIGPRRRPSIAGVLRHETIAGLMPDATVNPLLPHDGPLVVERVDPDIVLIETGAMTAGQPWGMAGDPAVADRGRRLVEIVRATRAIGRPSVLWWSGPRHEAAGLIPMESMFDLVVAAGGVGAQPSTPRWSAGVQLARFNALGADARRPCRPVLAGRQPWSDPSAWRWPLGLTTESATVAGIEVWLQSDSYPHRPDGSELPAGLRPLVSRWFGADQAPEVYRSNGLFIAEPVGSDVPETPVAERTLAQLASGARIISGPDQGLAATFRPWVVWAERADEVADAINAGPIPRTEHRSVMRSLFEEHSTAAAINGLLRSLGLTRTGQGTRGDVCVLLQSGQDARLEPLVDDVLRQRRRPAEVLVVGETSPAQGAVIDELRLAGLNVSQIRSTWDPAGLVAEAANRMRSPWLWLPTSGTRYPSEHVLDLLVAGQVSGADAVGWVGGEADRYVTELPLGVSIISREAALRLPDPTSTGLERWFAAGASLFGVASSPA